MERFEEVKLTKKNVLKFAIPAFIGAFIFLVPMNIRGTTGMLVGIILLSVSNALASYTPNLVCILMTCTTIATILVKIIKPKVICDNEQLNRIFNPGILEVCLRTLGTVLALLTLFEAGSEVIYGVDTGGTMLELCANIMVWFIVASFFIPFLLDFGLMEFTGILTSKIARPLLKIPGRSMIDVLTSFVGDQNLGIMLTNDQYIGGYYTGREAAIIATCFSATGIAYWYIISTILSVETYFMQIIITMFVTALVSTMIMVRIWPLSKIENTYYNGIKGINEDEKPEGMSLFTFSVKSAVHKALQFKGFKAMAQRSVKFSVDVIFSVIPVVMVIGTCGLVIATYTPVFDWLGLPFKYYLELLQVPEAAKAAPATVAGIADMLIPSLIGANIVSAKTRFIICVLSLSQIIYFSEVGPIMLMSKIPVNIGKLIGIFVVKTAIAIPIIALMATVLQIPA